MQARYAKHTSQPTSVDKAVAIDRGLSFRAKLVPCTQYAKYVSLKKRFADGLSCVRVFCLNAFRSNPLLKRLLFEEAFSTHFSRKAG